MAMEGSFSRGHGCHFRTCPPFVVHGKLQKARLSFQGRKRSSAERGLRNRLIEELDDNQKKIIFMRVLICKIHCPSLICFCKPSSLIYTSGPLKLENTPHVSTKTDSDPQREVATQSSTDAIDAAQEARNPEQNSPEKKLTSCLRKPNASPVASTEDQKKRVQWTDFVGQELSQIKEFESGESEENENEDENNRCVCNIL